MTQHNTHKNSSIIQGSILFSFCFLAVSLRLLARRITKVSYGWDDWWAVLTFLFYSAWIGCSSYASIVGAGGEVLELQLEGVAALEKFLKWVWISAIFVPWCMVSAKLSILCFYHRIFSCNQTFSRLIKLCGLINILWGIAGAIALVLKCVPVDKAWILSKEGSCFDFPLFTVLVETPNSLLDFVIMVLPINVLRGLQMPIRYKISLAIIFLLGAFVGIIGFIRIAILYQPQHFSLAATGTWVTIQLTFAVLCCCLPTYRPLFEKLHVVTTRYKSFLLGIWSTTGTRSDQTSKDKGVGFDRVESGPENDSWALDRSNDEILPGSTDKNMPASYPLGTITVRSTIDIV